MSKGIGHEMTSWVHEPPVSTGDYVLPAVGVKVRLKQVNI